MEGMIFKPHQCGEIMQNNGHYTIQGHSNHVIVVLPRCNETPVVRAVCYLSGRFVKMAKKSETKWDQMIRFSAPRVWNSRISVSSYFQTSS